MAGQSSKKGKKDSNESKRLKKVKCYNCKNFGHIAKECWAKGGGAEGKGPKGKGKSKEVAAKAEEKSGGDSDAVWMVSAGDENGVEASDRVLDWLRDVGGGNGSECELWTEEEINDNNEFAVIDYSPETISTESDIFSYDADVNDFFSETTVSNDDADTIPDLESVSESSEGSIFGADEEGGMRLCTNPWLMLVFEGLLLTWRFSILALAMTW